MKVGLVSIYDLNNYGNILQNIATSTYYRKLGYEPEVLLLEPYKLSIIFVNIVRRILKKKPINNVSISVKQVSEAFYNSLSEIDRCRFDSIKCWTESKLTIRHIKYWEGVQNGWTREYAFFSVGSDQVWNPDFGLGRDCDYLEFAPREKRVCFSPSFGVSEINDKKKRAVAQRLSEFANIGVREKSGADLIKKLTGRDAVITLDPTLMFSADEWRKILNIDYENSDGKSYILTYFLGKSNHKADSFISRIANQYNIPVRDMFDRSQNDLFTATPGDFVRLISNAKIVITDSFHATVFAILFNTPFVAFERDGDSKKMGSRIECLLEKLHLESRLYQRLDRDAIFEVDYTEAYILLNNERSITNSFVLNSINGI